MGMQAVLMDEFNCLGPYSDALPEECPSLRFLNKSNHIPLRGAFKTPSLRNVSGTAPYFHDGRFETLTEVIDFYNKPPMTNGPTELKALGLNDQQKRQLIAFLRTISSSN